MKISKNRHKYSIVSVQYCNNVCPLYFEEKGLVGRIGRGISGGNGREILNIVLLVDCLRQDAGRFIIWPLTLITIITI